KLDKSVVTGNLPYFRHRIYAYNDTPDTMLLYWTGHKDYTVYKGTPQNDLIGLISADLRVRYRFENSAGTGEIFYDGWQGQKAGTYWLEFPNGYKSGTPGDYPVAIQYKNASGTVLELGRMTVHVKNPAKDPDSKALFFDFNDDEAARLRYKNQPQYKEINFDGSNRWTYIEYHGTNKISDPTTGYVDTKAGILKIYSKTADSVRRNLSLYTFAEGKTPLNYNAKDAEIIQLRFKMDNLKAWEEQAPYFRMFYYYNNGTENVYTHDRDGKLGADFVSDGEYMTMTIPILTEGELSSVTDTYAPTQTLNSCTSITGLRPAFLNLVPIDTTKPASITFDYIYIGPEADAPVDEEENYLFFDFTDTAEDRERYHSEQYNFTNFDRQDNPFWATSETNSEVQVYNEREIDNKEGVIKVAVAETNAAGTNNANLGPWIATTGIPGVFVERANKPFHGLGYEPQRGDYVQVRFMLSEGVVRAGQDIPTDIVLVYDRTTDGTVARGTYDTVPTYEFKTGEYITVNFALTEEFTTADVISTIGFRFRGIKSETKGSGTLTIDYIYVGQEGTVPPSGCTVTFCNEDGTILEEQRVAMGATADYTGATPTKDYDKEKHYTFAGWVDGQGMPADLTNIPDDLTVYASFTATAHSYTEEVVSPSTCTGTGQKAFSCTCGYSYIETLPAADHSLETIPAIPATCTETGMTEGSKCSACGAVLTVPTEVPALGHSSELIPGKAASCLSSGLTEGSRCEHCGITLTVQEVIPRLGHDIHYTDLGENHLAQCSRCDKSLTEDHSYTSGSCICGALEFVIDESLTIYHSLNLASDISVNYIVPTSTLSGAENVYLQCVIPQYEGNLFTGSETVTLSPVEKGSYYYFTLEGLTAVHMNDLIQATLYLRKNGKNYCSETDEYSIATYAYSRLNSVTGAKKLKVLCADLLRYGAQIQIYKGYRTDSLADSAMTELHRSYLSSTEGLEFGTENEILNDLASPKLNWYAKALNLNSKITVRFLINGTGYTGDLNALTLKIRYTDYLGQPREAEVPLTGEYSPGTGYYVFDFDGLLAAELRCTLEVAVYDGEARLTKTLRYAPSSYCNGKTGQLAEVCKALTAYSDSALVFFTEP
ncbi:MAG: hypothetical protein II272_03905, partial [Oscillospiraceae bacterium]|nr:hypothetical protein [Oscillospiraceae bacterium]